MGESSDFPEEEFPGPVDNPRQLFLAAGSVHTFSAEAHIIFLD